jgi:quinoprotein glucose dehydrogenase
VELPTHDYYGGARPGNTLFAESLVAVDLKTGVRKWHFQLVHHGIWDMDIHVRRSSRTSSSTAAPSRRWRNRASRDSSTCSNRVTGQPVWPIEERPVPQGDTPGEKYSRTQPFPTRPVAYERQGLAADDLIDFTPELRAEALTLIEKYTIGPVFTPPVVSKAEGPIATLAMSTQAPATNWPGGSFDPETHVLYVHSNAQVAQLGLVPPPEGAAPDVRYHQGTVLSGARRTGGSGSATTNAQGGNINGIAVQGLPIIKPPYGRINAIDLDTGNFLWQVPHGETPEAVKNHPALKGLTIPRTGRNGAIGTLVTKTLVIAGEPGYGPTPSGARGSMLRAYDKRTGADAGAVYLPAPQSGSPMTYALNGKQYLVLAISGGNYSGELVAFALPN